MTIDIQKLLLIGMASVYKIGGSPIKRKSMKKHFFLIIYICTPAGTPPRVWEGHRNIRFIPCLFLSVSRAIHPCDRYGIWEGGCYRSFAAARDDESVPAQLHPSGNFAANKKYIFDGEKFVPDGESNSIFITSYPIDYYAYYPYATVDNPLEFTFHVAADQESLTESDLMYARNTDGSGKNNIPLTFIHKLSKVVVPYSRENVGGAAGTAVVNDAYTGCIMNLSTGEIRTLFDDGQQDIVMFKDGNAADVSFSVHFPELDF